MTLLMPKNVHFVLNPASGGNQLPLACIQKTVNDLKCRTTIHITSLEHSTIACTQDALNDNADLIVAYGGDGTVMEVANTIHPYNIPMAILPGGTANVIAHELNIPQDTQQALDIIFGDNNRLRSIDAGKIGDQHFLLRISIGWEAELSLRPTTEEKANWHTLAYIRAALQAIQDLELVTYYITLDDDTEQEVIGINCSICNIGNVGLYDIKIGIDVVPDDGYLNVFILENKSIQAILDITQNLLASTLPLNIEERLIHYKAKKITVAPNKTQRISYDGEPYLKNLPITVECVSDYIKIITPNISKGVTIE